MKLIGLTGYKRSGKDTVAKILKEHHGFHHYSFAQKLYDVCQDVLGLTDEELYTDKKDEPIDRFNGLSARDILIHIGTPGFRHVNDSVWIDYIMKDMDSSSSSKYVISDVRFENEANHIIDAGGIIIRVERPGCELGADLPDSGLYNVIPMLPTIYNDGSEAELIDSVSNLTKSLNYFNI